jgi:hypothetical protein
MNPGAGTFNVGLGTLPTGYAGYLTNDTANNEIALVLMSALHPVPAINSLTQSGTNLVISGTNGFANAPYYVLSTTNVALPLTNWVIIATNVFAPNGNFSFTTPIDPARPQRFFRIQVP